jgi:predicted O-methyltransferase YrrM
LTAARATTSAAAVFVARLDTAWPRAGRAPWPLFRRVADAYGEKGRRVLADTDVSIFLTVLYRMVRYFCPRRVVQTGTATGASAVAIGFGLRDNGVGHLVTIDPEPPSYFGVQNPVAVARAAVTRARLDDVVQFDRGYSTIPLDGRRMTLPDAPRWRLPASRGPSGADLVVIDGDHTPVGAHLDLVYGTRVLAADGPGLIVCHDYRSIAAVRTAFDVWAEHVRPRFIHVIPSPCGIAIAQM